MLIFTAVYFAVVYISYRNLISHFLKNFYKDLVNLKYFDFA